MLRLRLIVSSRFVKCGGNVGRIHTTFAGQQQRKLALAISFEKIAKPAGLPPGGGRVKHDAPESLIDICFDQNPFYGLNLG